ncbi:AAA family ATPase [Kitasatospora sp. NPDC004240]
MNTVSERGRQPGRAADGHRPRTGPDLPDAPPALAERGPQLDRIARAAARARDGHGSVLLLTGATGTGRSALLAEAARREHGRGGVVLWSRCAADESASAYAAARQFFETAPRPADPGTGPGECVRAEAELWDLLGRHTARGPLLLALDDVHLADEPSRRWLHRVARRIDRLPLLLLVTEHRQQRLDGPAEPAPGFGRGLPPALTDTHRLDPLTPGAATRLVRALAPARTTAALAADCARATGGNPLLLTALLADLRDHPLPPATTALADARALLPGGAYPDALAQWLRGGGERALVTARALAELHEHPAARGRAEDGAGEPAGEPPVAGRCRPAPMLGELCGADPERITGWLGELTAHGLLAPGAPGDWPAFAHPLLAAAARAGLPRPRRTELHLAAAEFMHRNGEPDELVAGHLLLTAAPGPRWAADTLRRAARTAEHAGRPAEAVALLRRALDEPLTDRRRGHVLTDLGGLEVTLGDTERTAGVRHLAEAVDLRQSDEGVFRAANTLCSVLATRGDTPAALEVMEELAERFADREELVHAVQAAAALIASHDGHSWLQVVEGLRRIAARTPHRLAPAAYALLTEFDSTNGVLSAAEVATRVDELVEADIDPLSRGYVLVSAATLAQWADRLPEADRLVELGLAAHRGPSLEPGYQCLLSVRAETHIMRGGYQALLDELHLTEPAPPDPRGAAAGRGADRIWWYGVPADAAPARARYAGLLGQQNAHLVAQAVIALTETGRLWQAHGLARTAAADRSPGSWEWNEYLYARGLLHLASGEPADALADLVECGRRQGERQVWSPIVTPWRSAAADCHLLLGEPGPAVALAEEELRLARTWGTPRAVGRALRALGAATGGRHGLDTAAEAVELLRGAGIDTELIPALITYGRLLGDSGRRGAARQALREAAARAERLGALRLRAIAVESLRATGARATKGEHTGTEALTDSELRICRLAAAGHSNGEIAGMLHLAVRTVETHLTNSFRKLGVRRRVELGGVLEG